MWKNKRGFIFLFSCLCLPIFMVACGNKEGNYVSEIKSMQTYDGYSLEGKLRLPKKGEVKKLVLFVNGSGPNTYDNKRQIENVEFNYYDLFAQEFTKRGIAFYTYNTRGITLGEEGPLFADIDEEIYQTYMPSNEVRDVEDMIKMLKEDARLKDAKVYLLGWSAGTIIAPLVAQRANVPVDGLLLVGYTNDKMEEVLNWQQTGGSSMVFYKQYFDYDKNGEISPEEFAEDRYGVAKQMGDITFTDIDATGDSKLTAEDFAILLADNRKAIFDAIENKDDAWLKEHYAVYLTSNWFWDYRQTPPNRETLPTLTIPIHIFHGEYDGNVSVEGVYAIEAEFQKLQKDNLTIHVFPDHDHDLNYLQYVMQKKIPQGIQTIFDVSETLE